MPLRQQIQNQEINRKKISNKNNMKLDRTCS